MIHRDEIEKCCHNFLHGNSYRQLHELIDNYERVFSHIDIQQFTQDTLDCSLHRICSEVFTHRPVSKGYIIAVLGFSEAIHKYHCSSSWYSDVFISKYIGGYQLSSESIVFLLFYIVNYLEKLIYTQGKVYLDMEFTHGNYYSADILEIALVSEESGYAFHSSVKIHYSVEFRSIP